MFDRTAREWFHWSLRVHVSFDFVHKGSRRRRRLSRGTGLPHGQVSEMALWSRPGRQVVKGLIQSSAGLCPYFASEYFKKGLEVFDP